MLFGVRVNKMNVELNKLLSNLSHLDKGKALVEALAGYTPNAYKFEILRKLRIILSFRLYHIDDKKLDINMDKVIDSISDILREYLSVLEGTPDYKKLLLPKSKHKCSEYMITLFDCSGCDDLAKCPIGNRGFCEVCGKPFT
ncbi:hypothetical protein LCGC14_0225480 [marine sediment metagenome]|uniref:Uncharacterized protein n=1 Tax=marine sediment metagenome TaxID=412755 RepID=A0A0F9UH31_9ZZZZ